MEEKKGRKFLRAYFMQLGLLTLLIVGLVLEQQGILPSICQPAAFLGIVTTVITFNIFAKQYK